MNAPQTNSRNRRTAIVLSLVVLGMFGFGFAMVPLYNLFCQVTGTQSIAQRTAVTRSEAQEAKVPTTREVVVKFDTTVNPNLPWEFEAVTQNMRVQPGKTYQVGFLARNRSNDAVTGQAIPSVVPWQATPYFSKMECFCFNRQTLAGGESAKMPLRFMVSPDLPEQVNSLTLSYSFLKVDVDGADSEVAQLSVNQTD